MVKHHLRAFVIAIGLSGLFLNVGSAYAGGRVALVVGDGEYKNVPKLESPSSNAHAMAELLRSVGFDVVEGTNLGRDAMSARFLNFGKKANGADIAIFYFAGRGIAVDGVNYLLPIDADIHSIADIKLGAAINIDDALDQTMQGSKVKLVFLDAGRDNPFAARITQAGEKPPRSASIPSGLAEMKSAEGTLISFATGPGQAPLDGPKDGHSPFTQALLDNIARPGVEIQAALTMVRAQVNERTNNQQLPAGNTNLIEEVYLNPKAPR
jgi:uncharacterized caspase-like protein